MGAVVAGVCFGMMAGGSLVYEMMPAREPRACKLTRTVATSEIFRHQANLLSAAISRGDALSKDDYRAHDDDVRRHQAALTAAGETYSTLFDQCEEATS